MNATSSYLVLATGGASPSRFKRPLAGPLQQRTISILDPYRPDAVVNCWIDDSGVRRVLGVSDFCLVRDWYDNPKIAAADIDYAARFVHYIRAFRRLGESDTEGYFAGRAVLDPWCIPAFWDAVEYGARWDMRWQVTNGYQYTSEAQRLDFEGRWATEGQRRGLSKFLFLVEMDNEYWQNGWLRPDLVKQHAEGEAITRLWRSIFNPMPFVAMGAPQSEAPDLILQSMLRDEWVCEIHTARDRALMVKRVFGTWYMEGHPGQLVLANGPGRYRILRGPHYVYGEPTPIDGGPDDFMGTTDPGAQIAQLAMNGQCGGASTYFDGWDVRSPEPLWVDAPTLESFPIFMMNFPEDTCTWPPVHGGAIWHWGKPHSARFMTVLDETWYAGYYPPHPIAHWTAYGPQRDAAGNFYPAGTVLRGTGKLVLPPGFGGAVIDGEWA